jgi:probable phosphoglycerate mutase
LTTFVLVRHATNDSVGKALAGSQPGVHLNREGVEEAHRLAARLSVLPITAVYSSPLTRAVETAEPLARRLGVPVRTEPELTEIDFGEWAGASVADLDRDPRWRQFNSFRIGTPTPAGETIADVQARMVAALLNIRSQHLAQTVVVVSHGDPLKAVVAYYVGIPLDLIHRIDLRTASITVLALGNHGAQLVRLNDTGELPKV